MSQPVINTQRPFPLMAWIEAHRHLLKPPVGNKVIWQDHEFIVMVVGGPNARTDYHVNEGEEFFYQLEGEMELKMMKNGAPDDVTIRAGEIFLLPANTPHSPRRPAESVGLVIERQRRAGELDGFQWYCPQCHHKLYEEFLPVNNLETQLPPVFERFYAQHAACDNCQTPYRKPAAAATAAPTATSSESSSESSP